MESLPARGDVAAGFFSSHRIRARLISRLVELPQSLLDLGELDFGLLDGLLQALEALIVVGHVFGAVGALVGTEVLDLFAAVLDFSHAKGCA
jgi:hypothetical protein